MRSSISIEDRDIKGHKTMQERNRERSRFLSFFVVSGRAAAVCSRAHAALHTYISTSDVPQNGGYLSMASMQRCFTVSV